MLSEMNASRKEKIRKPALHRLAEKCRGIREASDDRYLPACLYYTGLPEELQ